jgi:N-acetylglucosamine-6-phosphate deacetylase
LKKPISPECAVACAKAGSPLVILTDSGTIYWPISDAMPAEGQNERLMEFAGKRVVVTGKVYQRAGSRAIVISKVQAE